MIYGKVLDQRVLGAVHGGVHIELQMLHSGGKGAERDAWLQAPSPETPFLGSEVLYKP